MEESKDAGLLERVRGDPGGGKGGVRRRRVSRRTEEFIDNFDSEPKNIQDVQPGCEEIKI